MQNAVVVNRYHFRLQVSSMKTCDSEFQDNCSKSSLPMNLKLLQYLPYTTGQSQSNLHSPQWPVPAAIAENRHPPSRPTSFCGVTADKKCQNCQCSCHCEVDLRFRVALSKMLRFWPFKNSYIAKNIFLVHWNSCFCSISSINDDITPAKRRRRLCECPSELRPLEVSRQVLPPVAEGGTRCMLFSLFRNDLCRSLSVL